MARLGLGSANPKFASKIKHQAIAKLEKDNRHYIDQLKDYSRTIGQLETKLLQLEAPKPTFHESRRIPVASESAQEIFRTATS